MPARTNRNIPPESVSEDTTGQSEYRQNGDVGPKRIFSLTSGITSLAWSWPDDLDAMVIRPEFDTVLFEEDRVRVLDGRVPPGATVPVHTHRRGLKGWAGTGPWNQVTADGSVPRA